MTITKSNILVVIGLFALVAAIFVLSSSQSFGAVQTDRTVSSASSVEYNFFASSTNSSITSTTTTAISSATTPFFDSNGRYHDGVADIEGASRVVLACERGDKQGGGNTGSTLCSFQVSNDKSNWFTFNRFDNATSTGTFAIYSLSGTSTLHAAMDLQTSTWKYLRCTVTETTDGSHECRALITWD
jgi:hypothetical protein